jgi:P27 family predicted phage terminase small subunit
MSAKKPTELKLLQGNAGHRSLDLSTVFRPEVGEPSIPKWVSQSARKVWRRLMPDLIRYNLISPVDQDALAMLCQTSARLAMIELALAGKEKSLIANKQDPVDALLDVTPNGLRVQSALYQVLNKEQDKLNRQLEMFGLRPDARAKVTLAMRAQMQMFPAAGADKPAAPRTDQSKAAPTGFADFE